MKIRRTLPQFKNESVLLVVMGTHHGIIYRAGDGTAEKEDEMRVDNPEYTDNEGLFARAGDGKEYSFGSVLEPKRRTAMKEFSVGFGKKVLDAGRSKRCSRIFLFAAPEMKGYIDKDWKALLRAKIERHFDGNHAGKTPLALIAMIARAEQEDSDRAKEPHGDAKKLLEKKRRS